MAGPIKISILADAGQAIKSVTKFSDVVDSETKRVVTTLGDSKLQGGFGKWQEGFDVADTRAMGFRDTLTGVQDSMRGFQALTTSTGDATKRVSQAQADYNAAVAKYGKDSAQAIEANTRLSAAQEDLGRQQAPLIDKLFLMGTGVGDLASGFANFIVPLVAVGAGVTTMGIGTKIAAAGTRLYAGAQWLLNAAMVANPIGIVVVAVIALVAAVVIAYKRSETFRRIVQGAFRGVLAAAAAVWGWLKKNWPLLLAIITGPIGLAVRAVTKNFDKIQRKVRGIPGVIKGAFTGAGTWLADAGRRIVQGLVNAVQGKFDAVRRKFQELTNLIPSWKGPASRDRGLLRKPGDLIMDGLADSLEGRFGGIRSMLGGFTGSLAAGATNGIGTARVTSGSGSSTQSSNNGQLVVTFDAPTGDPIMRAIVAELRKTMRVNGRPVTI